MIYPKDINSARTFSSENLFSGIRRTASVKLRTPEKSSSKVVTGRYEEVTIDSHSLVEISSFCQYLMATRKRKISMLRSTH